LRNFIIKCIIFYAIAMRSKLFVFSLCAKSLRWPSLKEKHVSAVGGCFVWFCFCHMMSSSTFNNITPKSNKANYYILSVYITTMKRYIYNQISFFRVRGNIVIREKRVWEYQRVNQKSDMEGQTSRLMISNTSLLTQLSMTSELSLQQ
jgi:hypothetical protein